MYEAIARHFDDIYPACELATAVEAAVPDILEHLRPDRPLRVLDLCCGTGRGLIPFARTCPDAELYGVDSNKEMLLQAAINVPNAKFATQDVLKLDERVLECATFDLVTMFGSSMLHFSSAERAEIFGRVSDLLRPNGFFLFDTLKSGTSFQAETKEALIRRCFRSPVDGHRRIVTYVRHYEADKAHQHIVLIDLGTQETDEPSLHYDYIPFYPLTPEGTRSEAAIHGFAGIDDICIDYANSSFTCLCKRSDTRGIRVA